MVIQFEFLRIYKRSGRMKIYFLVLMHNLTKTLHWMTIVFLKENFYTENAYDSSKWDAFKSNDGVAADAIKDEWESSLKAWL